MWKAKKELQPIIINKSDYDKKEYQVICKLFGLDADLVNSFVLREDFTIEYNVEE